MKLSNVASAVTMKPSRFLSALAAATLLLVGAALAGPPPTGPAPSQPATPGAKPSLQTLSWLAGTWSFEKNGRVVTEIWMKPDGGTMPGMSRTVAQGRTVEYEFLLLRLDAAGDIFYVAKPSGQPEASFKLVRATTTEAIFENPQHDFPQRISYVLKPDGTLLAAIEGQKGGKARRVEFPYQRK
jgi:hypothetical protein